MRYLLEIAYDGTAYKGWQAQKKQTNSLKKTEFSVSCAPSPFFEIDSPYFYPCAPYSPYFLTFSKTFLPLNNENIKPKRYTSSFFRQNLSNSSPVLPQFFMLFNRNTSSHRKNIHQTTEEKHKTIQSTLEKILSTVLRENTQLYAAGRTDAGVHAKMQYAHFDSAKELKLEKIQYSINSLLKNELIIIKSIKKVDNAFHARFSCKMKEYHYQLLIGHTHDVFNRNKYWLIPKFNIEKANQCGKLLEGTHDFSSFRDSQCQAKSPIRSIESCTFIEKNNFIQMKIKAKSFLHHQIRIIIGTIFEIIAKNEPIEKIREILEQKTRQKAGITAPAKGLFLAKVEY